MILRELINLVRFKVDEQSLTAAEKRVGDLANKIDKIGKKASLFITLPLTALATMAVRTAAKLEQLQISFETMLGSADAAKKMIQEIITFSATTPFQLTEVQQGAKMLLAYNVAAEKVIPTLRMLGDVASGLDVPLEQLVRAYGQVQVKGRLMGGELLQFTEAGVPIIDTLAKMMGIDKNAVPKAIEDSKVSADMVTEAFRRMTGEGGKFFNLMEKQSKSFNGAWSNMLDSFTSLLNVIGKGIIGTFKLKEVISIITSAVQRLTIWLSNLNPGWMKFLVIATALVALLPTLLIGVSGLLSLLKGLIIFQGMLIKFAGLQSMLGLLLTPQFWLIAAGILAAAAALYLFIEDIYRWVQGDDSLAGRLLGPWEKWASGIKEIFSLITTDFGTFIKALGIALMDGLTSMSQTLQQSTFGKIMYWLSGIGVAETIGSAAGTFVGAAQTLDGGYFGKDGFGDISSSWSGLKNAARYTQMLFNGGNTGTTNKNVDVKSTIHIAVPEGTPAQQQQFIKKAAEQAVRKELTAQLNSALTYTAGAEK